MIAPIVLAALTAITPVHVTCATSDGGRVVADLYGTRGPGVVLARGGRFNKESWEPQARALVAGGFRACAFDFRGYGGSHGPGDRDPEEAPLWRDVLAAVHYLHAIGVHDVDAVGASMGGSAAADAALARPHAIERLVVMAATPTSATARISGPLLFIVSRDDHSADGPRLPAIRAAFARARTEDAACRSRLGTRAISVRRTRGPARVARDHRFFASPPDGGTPSLSRCEGSP